MIKEMLMMDSSDKEFTEFLSLLTSMRNPSDSLVSAVRNKYVMESSEEVKVTLMFTLTALAGEKSVSEALQQAITKSMLEKIAYVNKDNCPDDDSVYDVLEALGNLANPAIIDRMIEIGKGCINKPALVMGTVHALAEVCSDQRVIDFYTFLIDNAVCDVKLTVIGSLRDKISSDVVEGRYGTWPRETYNSLDMRLKEIYNDNGIEFHCIHDDILKYFSEKPDNKGEEFLSSRARKKRGIVNYSCTLWNPFDSGYTNIQDAAEFSADNSRYPNNKHCLAHFSIGPSDAHVNLYTGAFAGIDTGRCNWKIFAKIYADVKVLGKSFSIVSAYFYQFKYGTSLKLRGYLKIGSKTLIDYNSYNAFYEQTWSRYWIWNIDIWGINIYVAHLTLRVTVKPGVHLTVRVTPCGNGCAVCAKVTPKLTLQITGGGSASLVVARGGIGVNVHLNYLVEGTGKVGTTTPTCVSLYHGNDHMSVFFSAWYQRREASWWPPWVGEWGPRQAWSPESLSWEIGSASRKPIYDSCLSRNVSAVPFMLADLDDPSMYGDQDDPYMYGDPDDPSMYGDQDDPYMYGDPDDPYMYGDPDSME